MLSKKIISYISVALAAALALVMLFPAMTLEAAAVAVTGVSGVEVTVDSNGKVSESGGTVTISATGGLFSGKSTTVTITNTSGSTATIAFSYDVSGKVASNPFGAANGTTSIVLKSGATQTYTLKANGGYGTATLKLSGFSVTAAAENSNVTVTYGSLGSVKLDGTTIASGSVNAVSSSTGGNFVAVPGSGSKFVAWINPTTNAVLSTSATYQLIPTEAMSIRAVFAKASEAPVFFADGTAKVFESFNAAISYASSASNKVITLASDGTLAAGNYTIPAGVTLNIPYDAAGTLYTTKPTIHDNAYTAPSVFRTLNMASGANLTVNGNLILSAQLSSKYGHNGMPSGPLPFIKMAAGSKITVENGAGLYAWGFITGYGSVEIKSGGTVYENFQIADYRGGDATSAIVAKDDEYGVFPFNQYYVQNIEVPLTLHAGATETGYAALYVTIAGTQEFEVPFIGSDKSMFVLSSGYVVKDYQEGEGRTTISIHGDVSVSSISLDVKVSLIGELKIDSSKYTLPIPQHFTVSVESGNVTLNQSLALFPGSEFYIREGATCTLGEDKKIIVYDLDQWLYNEGANGYSGTTNLPYMKTKYVPGGDGVVGRQKDALVQVDGTVDATAGAIYVTSGGAKIYSTGTGVINLTTGTETKIYQVITNDTNIDSWPEIDLLPPVLKDAGDTNVSADAAGEYKYYAATGKWDSPDHRYEAVVTAPTCTEKGYTANVCIACKIDGDHYNETAALGHADCKNANGEAASDHFCDHCHLIMYYATNVRLGNSLDMMFAFPKDVFPDEPNGYYIKVVRHYADGSTKDETYSYLHMQWTVTEGFIYITYTGIAAKEMCDKIEVTVYNSQDVAVSITWEDSIRDYAMRLLEKHENNRALCTLLVDMLNYGAACQDYLNYGVVDLANALLSDVQIGYASTAKEYTMSSEDRPGWKASQLVVESNILYNIIFDTSLTYNGASVGTDELYVRYSYVGHKGNREVISERVKISDMKTVEMNGTTYHYIPIEKMVVADAAKADFAITITITDLTENTIYAQWTDSLRDYTARITDDHEVYSLFMQFAESAYTYLHTEEARI